jgi:hypothetical protein
MPRWLFVTIVVIVIGLAVAHVETTAILHNIINGIHDLFASSGLHWGEVRHMAQRMTVQDYMDQGYNKAQAQRHVDWDTQREMKSVAAEIGVTIRRGRSSNPRNAARRTAAKDK